MSGPLFGSTTGVELGDLVGGLLTSVVEAQLKLDVEAQRRTDAWLYERPADDPTPPPLWFTVRSTAVEVQLTASLRRVTSTPRAGGSAPDRAPSGRAAVLCRTANPVDATLIGYEAVNQLRVRVVMDAQPRDAG